MTTSQPPQDDAPLIDALRAAGRELDPVPEALVDMAMAGYDLGSIEFELAELVADTGVAPAAGVRATTDVRAVIFETRDVTIDLEVGADGAVIGSIDPAVVEGLTIHQDGARTDVEVSPGGTFRAALSSSGPFRLLVRLADRIVATGWLLP